MIFHLVLNSLLVFLILAFLIELTLRAFKIENPRVRYFCRMLAFLKLPFDIVVFSIYGDSLFVNFNPFSCEMYVQELLETVLPMPLAESLRESEHIIVPGYVATLLPSFALKAFVVGVVLISICVTLLKIIQICKSIRELQAIIKNASPCPRAIHNTHLVSQIAQAEIRLLVSPDIAIPFAANSRDILFPKNLTHAFSQDEFEAVAAHELEHLRWRDPIFKVCCGTLCALFWWLPTNWLLKRIENDQEDACDRGLNRYGLNTFHLASALIKVVNVVKGKKQSLSAICHFDASPNMYVRRISSLLNECEFRNEHFTFRSIVGCGVSILAFLCFWMC